jgi:hypothetical protein
MSKLFTMSWENNIPIQRIIKMNRKIQLSTLSPIGKVAFVAELIAKNLEAKE